ncbi:hypothetical protein Deipe_0070 [Deinococcus peraridilitoris DSM 19664]|uniref:Uncharacterized protein n=1 Tax=Deinococcus peraridilitoris (strain DSM 19664 / LMG 22246 / CIP 109416 / KR-200) TaxID=937777 RepID=K9ZVP1_DEIPD|nr:hypothetical protein Deipe_0070 [Deinococcus peraridilitoris DSM 19664]
MYLRSTQTSARQAMASLEQQQEHILGFMARHDIREVARYLEITEESFEQLHEAAREAKTRGAFVLLNHVDDLKETIDQLVAEGVNFVSAQSANQALFSFGKPV